MTVRQELESLAKISQDKTETDIEYQLRLIETVDEVVGDNDELFMSLSVPAQNWLNHAIRAYNSTKTTNKSIPPFPEETPKTDPKVEQPSKKTPTIPTRNPNEKRPKTALVKEIICLNRDWTLIQVREEVAKQGLDCKQTTVDAIYSDTRATLKVLTDLGLI